MRIGIDLDNTIVCYDQVFWDLAVERGWIAATIPARKERVRDELRRLGREADWTLLQGEVYGSKMGEARPFPQALEAIQKLPRRDHFVFVISHRTRTPFAGPSADLHAAARDWLERQGFISRTISGLTQATVFLETTKAEKLARIDSLELDFFIDDLPELLLDPAFPLGVRRILFDPHQHRPKLPSSVLTIHDWSEVIGLIDRESPP